MGGWPDLVDGYKMTGIHDYLHLHLHLHPGQARIRMNNKSCQTKSGTGRVFVAQSRASRSEYS